MAVKGKSKDSGRVALTRRPKRRQKIRCKETLKSCIPRKSLKNDTHIGNLPDEILLNIFCYFTSRQLYCNIRPVCRRWMVLAMSPILWRVIDVKNEVPTNTLTYWIKISPLLKRFSIENRNDTDIITEQLVKCCKQLEYIKMENCWGSPQCSFIRSTPLCTLVRWCLKLYKFNFSHSRFVSGKFFRLISRDRPNRKIMKKCNYIGPMTVKQLRAIFAVLRDQEVNDTAIIGDVNFTQKLKLKDIIRYLQQVQNSRQAANDIWQYLYYCDNGE